ncbi:hypothetical protein TWF694_004678 [Orbilia ellipsospora]|uniref:Ricin B lectin domain-containing protein n=1 Tax=Orbilia ellipsospora TaxID=2528407 RepID=A0AAV9WW08_9PEZI
MSVGDGAYFMYSAIEGGDRVVYRSPIEDISLRPKNIWTLHPGTRGGLWIIQRTSGDAYILKAIGAPAGIYSANPTKVYAFPIESMAQEKEWVLEPTTSPLSYRAREAYKIRNKDGSQYWQTGEDEFNFGRIMELKPKDDVPEQVFYLHRIEESLSGVRGTWKEKFCDTELQSPMGNTRERQFRG